MAPNTQRYERVPQTQDDLYSLHSVSDNYNYGSGVPSSPPPSFHSNANIRPSVPSSYSAPGPLTPSGTCHSGSGSGNPSYHTARHPLTSSNLAALPENDEAPPYHFRGGDGGTVAETLVDRQTIAEGTVMGDSDRENAMIINLHKRISQLESSMGRLLIQNDELRLALAGTSSEDLYQKRTNCCVAYKGEDEQLQQMLRGRDNCCLIIGGKKKDGGQRTKEQERAAMCYVTMAVVSFLAFVITILVVLRPRNSGGYTPPSMGH